MHHGWRRYRAAVKYRSRPTNLAESTRARLEHILAEAFGNRWRRIEADELDPVVFQQAQMLSVNANAVEWFALLLLRSPAATRAQQKMDTHPEGRDKQERLYDLIDFNDAFVSTVLALSDEQREGFIDIAHHEIARFCMQVGARMFSDEQFDAIVRGLSREVAVYLGAKREGFEAEMTSRSQDALGVDIVITDPATSQSINIDVKTSSSFHYRLKDLVREGRLSQDDANRAELDGYAHELNGHPDEAVRVTLLRVDPNEMGDVEKFMFVRPELLGARLRRLFQES